MKNKKISGHTFYIKIFFPGIWFGFLGALSIVTLVKGQNIVAILPMILMMLFGFFLFRKLAWDLADEVFDEGDSLLFRKGKKQQRIALKDVINISHARASSPDRVTIHTRESGDIGKELTFSLPTKLNPFSKSPIVTDLIERVDRARNT